MCFCVCVFLSVCLCIRRSLQFAASGEQQWGHLQFLEIRPNHSPLPSQRHAAVRQGSVWTCACVEVLLRLALALIAFHNSSLNPSGPVWAADGAAALCLGAAVLQGDGVQHARTQQAGMTHVASVPQQCILVSSLSCLCSCCSPFCLTVFHTSHFAWLYPHCLFSHSPHLPFSRSLHVSWPPMCHPTPSLIVSA